ncbi:hypothetical protein FA95DRAFT_1222037 [Auriscalpium vulgare]|uniref:Uncharacterized protein n=1 Tax=Auriscalpium vulgare TaxID=40419 RepID=A0ACB8RUK4_9AGAM|nr:hypothetical protein FA95DRAFT_1222037 [Auriscalpium vulgare]
MTARSSKSLSTLSVHPASRLTAKTSSGTSPDKSDMLPSSRSDVRRGNMKSVPRSSLNARHSSSPASPLGEIATTPGARRDNSFQCSMVHLLSDTQSFLRLSVENVSQMKRRSPRLSQVSTSSGRSSFSQSKFHEKSGRERSCGTEVAGVAQSVSVICLQPCRISMWRFTWTERAAMGMVVVTPRHADMAGKKIWKSAEDSPSHSIFRLTVASDAIFRCRIRLVHFDDEPRRKRKMRRGRWMMRSAARGISIRGRA